MSDDEMWSQIEANEMRLWVSPGESGVWCDVCNLPSAVEITVQSDPADQPEVYGVFCTNRDMHPDEETK